MTRANETEGENERLASGQRLVRGAAVSSMKMRQRLQPSQIDGLSPEEVLGVPVAELNPALFARQQLLDGTNEGKLEPLALAKLGAMRGQVTEDGLPFPYEAEIEENGGIALGRH